MATTATLQEHAQSLEAFIGETRAQDTPAEAFGNETARTLRIDVDGGVWLKPGAAVAYRVEPGPTGLEAVSLTPT